MPFHHMSMEKYVNYQLGLSLDIAHDQLAKIVNFSLLISNSANMNRYNPYKQQLFGVFGNFWEYRGIWRY